jgi:ABC-type phosphate/phosphonate transport system substrate-binding protein
MIACLPMYDWPQVRAETDRLWSLIREALATQHIIAPASLTRDKDPWAMWQSPDLVLGQTCGMPYRTRLHGQVQLVGTPDFALPDTPAGFYHSEMIVRADSPGAFLDFVDRKLAINGFDSQSGWAAPQNLAASLGRSFSDVVITGAHRDSAKAVAEGRADIAAIDAVSWRLVQTHLPDLTRQLRIVRRTPATPGLPLITAPRFDRDAVARAVSAAIAALSPADRSALGVNALVSISADTYLGIPTPARLQHRQSEH